MIPTGRRIAGPSSDLVELEAGGDEGLKHFAIAYHERYRTHAALNRGAELIENFMRFPMVTGLVELSDWLRPEGAFVYPTGTSWTIAEITRLFRDLGQTVGVRATVEMLYLAGLILQEAAEIGPAEGVFAHGSLSPQRVLVKADGQVQIIGHGLPQVELMVWREEGALPNEDAFRYAPPERLAGGPEDADSDLYALCLVAWEMIAGEPIYDGTIDQIRTQAEKGEALSKVDRAAKAKKLPKELRELFERALAVDGRARHPSPADFVAEVESLLQIDSKGSSLAEIMERVRGSAKRGRSLGAAAPREIARGRGVPVPAAAAGLRAAGGGIPIFAGAAARPVAAPAAPPPDAEDGRWSKPARARGDDEAQADDPRSRLRDRLRKTGEEEAEDPRARLRDRLRRGAAEEAEAEDPRARLRDRLRRGRDGDGAPDSVEEAPKEESKDDARERLRDRLRRSASDATEPAAEPSRGRPERGFGEEESEDERPTKVKVEPKDEPAPEPAAAPEPEPAAAEAAAEPADEKRESLRDRLRKRAGEEQPVVEEPKEDNKEAVDARAALRERLRARKGEEAAAEEPKAAAPAAPAPEPEKPAEDARAALRNRLKDRKK